MNLAWVLVLGYLTLCLAGCDDGADTHEKIRRDMVTVVSDLNDILDEISDEHSALAARPKIDALAKQIDRLTERLKALPRATRESAQELRRKFRPQLDKQKERRMANMERLKGFPEAKVALRVPLAVFDHAVLDFGWEVSILEPDAPASAAPKP